MPMGKRIVIRRLNIFVDAQSTRIAIVPKGAQKLAGLYNSLPTETKATQNVTVQCQRERWIIQTKSPNEEIWTCLSWDGLYSG
jgi:hypothetical protein